MSRLFMLLLCAVHLIACGDGESYPPMITGYSRQGTLETFNPQKHFSMQADFKLRSEIKGEFTGEGASAFTVSFEIIDNFKPSALNPVFAAPMAKLTWSVEGNTYQRIVSVRSGTSITGVGEHLTVDMWDDARMGIVGTPPPPALVQEYDVCVTAAPGVRGPASVGPVIIPWVYSTDGATAFQNYGFSQLDVGGGVTKATVSLIEYPLVSSLFFTVGSDFQTILDTDIFVGGVAAGGSITTFAANGKSAGIWIPMQSQTDEIQFLINPLAVDVRFINVVLGVDG